MNILASIVLLLTVGGLPNANAALGEKATSISEDQSKLSAKLKKTASATASTSSLYTTQELVSDETTVKEYINSTGTIFAVTWRGTAHPDLSTLLGSYYSSFAVAEKNQGKTLGRRNSKKTESNHLVVQRFGHMGDLKGIAYDSSLIPAGVSIDEIK